MGKWSHSLDVMVRTCPRRVFYRSRFASPTARRGSPRHKAFLLSQALELPAWRGRVVHSIIEGIIPDLKKRIWPDFERLKERAKDLVTHQAEFSRTAKYLTCSKSSDKTNYCVLRADFLGDGLTAQQLEETKQCVITAIDILEEHHLDLLARIRSAHWAFSEKEIRFNLDAHVLVEAIPDLIFYQPGRGVIVDWKLWDNTRGTARDQLHAYAFAALKCGWWPELRTRNLELIEANLITGDRNTYQITEEDLDDVDDRIFTGMDQLSPVFELPVHGCIPETFAPAEGPGACQHCSVLEVCNGSFLPKGNQYESIPLELFSFGRSA
ncbi:MAG: hypothetical protein QOE96_3781 [Blastocatellia bacterium]|nr:hypothetical protein [Blastocatellia bacterium]